MSTKQSTKTKIESESKPQEPELFASESAQTATIKIDTNKARLEDIWLPLGMVLKGLPNGRAVISEFAFLESSTNDGKKIACYRRGEGKLIAAEDGTCYTEDETIGLYVPISREAALDQWPDLAITSINQSQQEPKQTVFDKQESSTDTAASETDREDAEMIADAEFVKPIPSAIVRYEPSQLIALAIERNLDVEKLRELMALEREWREDKAKAEFAIAMAHFGELKQVVQHNRTGKTAGNASFSYSDFPATVRAVTPWLTRCGLSFTHRQDPPVMAETKVAYVMVYCNIQHSAGFSKEYPYPAIPDLRLEGKVSPSQLIQLAITYAKRQTLCMGLGLATAEDANDLDSQVVDGDGVITEQQVKELEKTIEVVGANLEMFLKFMQVEKLGDIPLSRYGWAQKKLEEKKQKNQSEWKCTPGDRTVIEGFRDTLRKRGVTEKQLQEYLYECFPEEGISVESLGHERAQMYASYLAGKVNPK